MEDKNCKCGVFIDGQSIKIMKQHTSLHPKIYLPENPWKQPVLSQCAGYKWLRMTAIGWRCYRLLHSPFNRAPRINHQIIQKLNMIFWQRFWLRMDGEYEISALFLGILSTFSKVFHDFGKGKLKYYFWICWQTDIPVIQFLELIVQI